LLRDKPPERKKKNADARKKKPKREEGRKMEQLISRQNCIKNDSNQKLLRSKIEDIIIDISTKKKDLIADFENH
jgi:hypothetical protein